MRKALIIAGSILAVVVLAGVAVLLLVDVDQFRPQIQAQMEKSLDRPVKLGALGLSLLPLAVRAGDIEIGEAPAFRSSRPFVSARSVQVRVGLMALLRRQIQVESILVDAPSVELIKNRSGDWNFASFQKPSGSTSKSMDVTLNHVAVRGARFAVTNHQSGAPRWSLDDPMDLEIRRAGSGAEYDVEIKSGAGRLAARASLGQSGLSASGSVTNFSVPVAALTQPIRLQSAAFRIAKDATAIEKLEASLGPSTLKGQLSIRGFTAPRLAFDLELNQLDVDRLGQLIRKTSSAPASGETERSAGLPPITGAGKLAIGSLRAGGLELSRVQSKCALDGGVIRLDPVEAAIAGGTLGGTITIDARTAKPVVAVNASLARADANQILSSTTNLKGVLFGMLTGKADSRFVSGPAQEMARGLNGTIELQLTDGKLEGVNLVNEMATLGRFLNFAKRAETFTSIVRMTGSMRMADGIARTDDLRVEFDGGSMNATGTVSLIDQSLNLELTTQFTREFSERVGGKLIGGFMNTVLGTETGELVIPALVTGTASRPRFAPDARRFARMRLGRMFDKPAGGGDKLTVDSILDRFRRKKEPPPPK